MTIPIALLVGCVYALLVGAIVYVAIRRTGSRSVFATAGDTSSEFKLLVLFVAGMVAANISAGLLAEVGADQRWISASWYASGLAVAAYICGRSAIKIAKTLSGSK